MSWLLIASAALLPWPCEAGQDAPARGEVRRTLTDVLAGRDYQRPVTGETVGGKILDWLKRLFEGVGGLPGWMQRILLVLCIAILVAIGVHFLVTLYRSTRVRRDELDAIAAARGADPRALLDQARKAADPATALSLYLRAALAGLDRRGVLRLGETSTVREVRAVLASRPDAAPFGRLVDHYEPGVFGRKAVPPGAISDCDAAAVALIGGA